MIYHIRYAKMKQMDRGDAGFYKFGRGDGDDQF